MYVHSLPTQPFITRTSVITVMFAACGLCSGPFIYPTNLALSMFKRLDDGVNQLHFCTTPLTGIFNAPNFTGKPASQPGEGGRHMHARRQAVVSLWGGTIGFLSTCIGHVVQGMTCLMWGWGPLTCGMQGGFFPHAWPEV